MKKIIIAIALIFGSAGFMYAQTPTPAATAKKQKKEKTTSVQTTTTQSTGLKKDGTPDMRLKANKTKAQTTTTTVTPNTTPVTKVQTQTTTTVQPKTKPVQQVQPKVQTQVSKTTSVKTADAAIGTDAKGRTLYQGPKGGKYYINKNGNKEYVK